MWKYTTVCRCAYLSMHEYIITLLFYADMGGINGRILHCIHTFCRNVCKLVLMHELVLLFCVHVEPHEYLRILICLYLIITHNNFLCQCTSTLIRFLKISVIIRGGGKWNHFWKHTSATIYFPLKITPIGEPRNRHIRVTLSAKLKKSRFEKAMN